MRRGAGTARSDTADGPPPRSFRMEIRLDSRLLSFQAYEDEYILDAAIRHGLPLTYLCRQGWCTRCAVRVEWGEVDQTGSRRFYTEDRQAGFSLICTARPLSDVRMVADQHSEIRVHRVRLGLPTPRG
jgi:ferredoxin